MKKIFVLSLVISIISFSFESEYSVRPFSYLDPIEQDYIDERNDPKYKREERLKNNKENYEKHKEFMDSILGYWRNNGQMIIIGKDEDGYYLKNIKYVEDRALDILSKYMAYPKLREKHKVTDEKIKEARQEEEAIRNLDVLRDGSINGYILYEEKEGNRLWFDGEKFGNYFVYNANKNNKYDDFDDFMASSYLTINNEGKLTYIPKTWQGIGLEEYLETNKEYKKIKYTPVEEIDISGNIRDKDGKTIEFKNGKAVTRSFSSNWVDKEMKEKIGKELIAIDKHEDPNFTGKIFIPFNKEETKRILINRYREKYIPQYELYELNKKQENSWYFKKNYMYEPMRRMTQEEIDIYNSYVEYKKPTKKEAADIAKRYKVTTNIGFGIYMFQLNRAKQQMELDNIRKKITNTNNFEDMVKKLKEMQNK